MDYTMEDAIALYKSGLCVAKVEEQTKINRGKLSRNFKKLGIIRSNKINSRKYTLDNNFFEVIDTENKAYWLGFLYADGYVSIRKDCHAKCVGLSISVKDEDHLAAFKKATNATYPINHYSHNAFGVESEYVRLLMTSEKMYDNLVANGVVEHKTLILTFPTHIPENITHHFIRGYFDGDGSFAKSKVSIYQFKVCGTKEFLTRLAEHIGHPNPHFYKRWKQRDNNNYSIEVGGRKQVEKIGDYMYKDATIYLTRKYDRYLELKYNYKYEH